MSDQLVRLTDLKIQVATVSRKLVKQLPQLRSLSKAELEVTKIVGVYDLDGEKILVTVGGEPFWCLASLFYPQVFFRDNHWVYNGTIIPYLYLD